MSESYRGITVPSYTDHADGPKAFKEVIDGVDSLFLKLTGGNISGDTVIKSGPTELAIRSNGLNFHGRSNFFGTLHVEASDEFDPAIRLNMNASHVTGIYGKDNGHTVSIGAWGTRIATFRSPTDSRTQGVGILELIGDDKTGLAAPYVLSGHHAGYIFKISGKALAWLSQYS